MTHLLWNMVIIVLVVSIHFFASLFKKVHIDGNGHGNWEEQWYRENGNKNKLL